MDRLAPYIFDDTLMIDFSADHHLRSLTIISEAYIHTDVPQADAARQYEKIRLIVTINRPRELVLTMNGDLWDDLERPYDVDGNDSRANEVYAMSVIPANNPRYPNADTITIRSDGVILSAISVDVIIRHAPLRSAPGAASGA